MTVPDSDDAVRDGGEHVGPPDRMHAGVRIRAFTDERLEFLTQIGVESVFLDHSGVDEEPDEFIDNTAAGPEDRIDLHGRTIPTAAELIDARERIEAHGLRLAGIHSLPYSLYGDVMFGRDGAGGAIELVRELLSRMGEAGVPILGYQWNPRGLVPMRTDTDVRVRGNARATGFDLSDVEEPDRPVTDDGEAIPEETFWANYERFLEGVLPVAERAGVTMAVHPTDPPGLPSLGGIPRLLRDVESFERAMELVPSDNHGLKLCLGCFSELLGSGVREVIETFGARDEIVFVHFRDVRGTMPAFNETFLDDGNYDEYDVLRALDEVGYDGALLPDHVPRMAGDSQWGHRANGWTVGYVRGMLRGYYDGGGTAANGGLSATQNPKTGTNRKVR